VAKINPHKNNMGKTRRFWGMFAILSLLMCLREICSAPPHWMWPQTFLVHKSLFCGVLGILKERSRYLKLPPLNYLSIDPKIVHVLFPTPLLGDALPTCILVPVCKIRKHNKNTQHYIYKVLFYVDTTP
jgi:hypothetical protein